MAPAPKRRKTNPTSFPSMTSGYKSNTVRKSHKVPQVEELKFDPSAREEYLTGFHKRKLQRIKHAQEQAKKMEKEEALVNRRELRQERKDELFRHVQEVNALLRKNNPDISDDEENEDENEEWDGITEAAAPAVPAPDGVDEYVDEDKYTTVTIETMDDDPRKWDKDGSDDEGEVAVVEEAKEEEEAEPETGSKKRVWTKEKPKKEKGDKTPKKKKQKFRYESKFERQQTRTKQRAKNRAAADARKADR